MPTKCQQEPCSTPEPWRDGANEGFVVVAASVEGSGSRTKNWRGLFLCEKIDNPLPPDFDRSEKRSEGLLESLQ